MAELHVQPKNSRPWWLWLLLALVAIGLIFFLMRNRDHKKDVETATTETTTNTDTTTTATTTTTTTDDDWNTLDRNVPIAKYDEITDKDIEVRGNDNYAIYSLNETVLFDSDKSKIKRTAEKKLKQVAASLDKRYKDAKVRIFGYADASGTAEHNKELSEKRAEAVQNWLAEHGNVSKDNVSIHPIGEAQPAESNATEKGKAQNRRVEIVARKAQ